MKMHDKESKINRLIYMLLENEKLLNVLYVVSILLILAILAGLLPHRRMY